LQGAILDFLQEILHNGTIRSVKRSRSEKKRLRGAVGSIAGVERLLEATTVRVRCYLHTSTWDTGRAHPSD
jgi:hypothetical protein